MIMTAVDMVNRMGHDLDEATIRDELEGNICRCTGYHNIVKSIAAGRARDGRRARRPRPPSRPRLTMSQQNARFPEERESMSATGIGASVKRKEDIRFITGKGHYIDDINRPGQAYAYFLRSPHAHATIDKIDAVRRAEARRAWSRSSPAPTSRPTRSAA